MKAELNSALHIVIDLNRFTIQFVCSRKYERLQELGINIFFVFLNIR